GAAAPAAGWLISIVVLLSGRPEGDYVFGDALGLGLFMLGGMAIAVICATMSRSPPAAGRQRPTCQVMCSVRSRNAPPCPSGGVRSRFPPRSRGGVCRRRPVWWFARPGCGTGEGTGGGANRENLL
ncbi:hypothetical protein GTV15_17405, partial [Streptomyces sp. SID7803]|nr:hypothetical protein [Streptomyces sp. SID7803]